MSAQNQLNKDIVRISSDTMTDVVELRLRDYFKKKLFKPGDALPKELELAEALGVSRNVVREALSRLRMLGMIESKKKRGMILASPDVLGAFERVLDPLIIAEETLQDLFELRLVLEMGMADVLFMNMTDKGLQELKQIVDNEFKDDQQIFRIKNEIAFHGKLYEIAGNNTLKRFQNLLLPVFGYVLKLEKEFISGSVSHRGLVELLEKRNKDDFRQGMYEHLRPHFMRLEQIKK
jgi:GntR family transcriptional repressor for pyruvate dehydrogenase complex